jgi:uracil-DNA glycosylase
MAKTPPHKIDSFIADLAALEQTPSLFNPFRENGRSQNLNLYLNFLAARGAPLALVGEAAGHRGCALTGMPFTCPETLRQRDNPFFSSHRRLMAGHGDVFEPSGRSVWGVCDARGVVPLLWNALPLHPHLPGKPRSNRTPTRAELELGLPFLARILAMFSPKVIVAVGKKAEASLAGLSLPAPAVAVRHPSMGGSTLFKTQMTAILDQLMVEDA